jgi:hypothetical protein
MLSMQRPFPIHANCDAASLEHAGKVVAGELATLVRVEDLGPAVVGQGFLQSLDAKVGAERVR